MTADTVGGVWPYALELARALPDIGFALATMGAPVSARQRDEADGIANVDIFESTYRLEWMDNPWADVAAAGRWLLGLEARLKPDVVHLNGYTHARLPWRAPVVVVAHSCVLSWWRAVKREPAPACWDRYREEVRAGLEAAGLVVAPTHAMLASLRENYGPVRHARVIPNGRTPQQFPPGIKENFILASGRLWDEGKNAAALERVAPRLRWPVYLAGEGAGEPAGAHRLGRLAPAELARWYGRAAIFAHPARYEPFGLSVLEAALAGCALVLGDIPSLRENWYDAALFVPPDDDAALERALNGLIEDPHTRAGLRARASARAAHFHPARMAAAYRAAAYMEAERLCA
ncbi:MAG: glycosyltransferase family 4 protein [Acidobacteriota bacterium]